VPERREIGGPAILCRARRPALSRCVAAAAALVAFGTTASTHDNGHGLSAGRAWEVRQERPAPRRIVSLVPSVTESLFAIGAGPQVVAVSSFDREPPEVERLPRVGALVDPDVERIISLTPDLVIVYGSQVDLRAQLERARIPTWPYRHAGLADVVKTIEALGRTTGHVTEAARVTADIERQLAGVRARAAGRGRPGVLLVFGREPGTLRNIYASGGTGFLHDLVELAGGRNVFADVARESVQASTEVILTRRPDIVIELQPDATGPAAARDAPEVWSALPSVPAVGTGRIHVLAGSELVVPGPRVGRAAERLAAAIHP
jgi:iron complex transport system substrate-binding protein